jgi:hypothetical protein
MVCSTGGGRATRAHPRLQRELRPWAVQCERVRAGQPAPIPPRGPHGVRRGYSGESRHAPATLAGVGSARTVTCEFGRMTTPGDRGRAATVNSSTMRGPKGLAGKT